jgi:CheY-like chemotaxis protein
VVVSTSTSSKLRVAVAVVALLLLAAAVARRLQTGATDLFEKADLGLLAIALGAAGLDVVIGKDGIKISDKQRQDAAEALDAAQKERDPKGESGKAKQLIGAAPLKRPIRILWVDDEPGNNYRETLVLTQLGFAVTSVFSRKDAWPFINTERFDLVISDMSQPGESDAGIKLSGELKQSYPRLPLVIYRGRQDEKSDLAIKAGARSVVTTPYELVQAVYAST